MSTYCIAQGALYKSKIYGDSSQKEKEQICVYVKFIHLTV